MSLLEIVLANPPNDDESTTQYCKRLSSITGISHHTHFSQIKKLLKKKGYKQGIGGLRLFLASENQSDLGKTTISQQGNNKTIEYKGEKSIQSLEDAIEFFEIDTTIWQVQKWVANSWDVSMKDKDGHPTKKTNYQVKLWLVPSDSSIHELKAELSRRIAPKKIRKPLRKAKNGSLMIEPCIFDHHFGKVGLDTNTFEYNWSLEEATKQYHKAIERFLSEIKGNSIDQIVFPIGNDFFNIDTPGYTTTKGTPQMSGELWQKIYTAGCHTKVAAIQALAQVAPVHIYCVPGNHDWMLGFTMGEYLQASFRDSKWIRIDNTPERRKYHEFGSVLTGYTHGDKIKPSNLHHTMSVDVPDLFGKAKYRHFKVGHLHKNAEKQVLKLDIQNEFNGVSIFWCPSLCPADVWHYQNLFVGNERRSKTFIYHKTDGLEKVIYYNLQK